MNGVKQLSRILVSGILLSAQIIPYFSLNTQKASAATSSVRICHVNNNVNSPYVSLSVSADSVDGLGAGDHYLEHTGPIATSVSVAQQFKDNHESWGDIIPPVPGVHAGLNWTSVGQAIWNANCSITTIEVKKVLVPANDPGLFNLKIEGSVYATNIGNNGTTGAIYIDDTQDISVGETAGTSTALGDYSTSIVCKNDNGNGAIVETGNPASVNSRDDTISNLDISAGDAIVCVFTNTRLFGTLVVNKILNQDNGGNKTASDFSFTVSNYNSGNPIAFESDGSNSLQVPIGTYSVVETATPGYDVTYQTCSDITITANTSKTCTITNTSQPAYLTVTKVVQNNNGGNAQPDDFGLTVNGKLVLSGQKKAYLAGTPLTLDETQLPGYEFVSITGDEACPSALDGSLTLQPGDDISCTITNKDVAPTVTIVKKVINDNGGTLTANDFGISMNDSAVSFGTPQVNGFTSTYTATQAVTANTTIVLSEEDTPGYSEGSWSCTNSETVIIFTISFLLEEGQNITCTVTNNDQAPALSLIKNVVNSYGGNTTADAWTLIAQHANDTPVIAQQGMIAPQSNGQQAATPLVPVESGVFYTLSESNGPTGYVAGEWTCEGGELVNGAVKLVYGTKVFCSITNTEVRPTLTVVKYATNDNGGTMQADDFTLYVNNEELTDPEVSEEVEGTSSALYELPLYSNAEYNVSESEVPGYENTSIDCMDVTNGLEDAPALSQPFTASSGMKVRCEVYNNDKAPVVHVTKTTEGEECFYDESWYDEENWCEGERFNFTMNLGGEEYTDFGLGNGDEFTTESDMKAGVVEVTEAETEGWFLVEANCYSYANDNMMEYLSTTFKTEIGKEYYCDFYNEKAGQVIVTKFHDYDEDGEWDEGEPALSDWEMTLTPHSYCEGSLSKITAVQAIDSVVLDNCEQPKVVSMKETTDEDGEALFDGLRRGRYDVDEIMQDGWVQSSIYCENDWDKVVRISSEQQKMSHSVYVRPGQTAYCYVGNYKEPQVSIEKTNNTTGPVLRGTQITFTIVITVPGVATSGILHGTYNGSTYVPVTVFDEFTNEFEYIIGSYTAVSSIRGDLKAQGIVTDPNYASPGTWNLTSETSNDVLPGEVITLTYKGIVEPNAPAAKYKTTATVTGYGDTITVQVSDTDDDQVLVYVPAVLGTSTTAKKQLASTGSNAVYALILGCSVIAVSWQVSRLSKKQPASSK